jgi:hypothetical protein
MRQIPAMIAVRLDQQRRVGQPFSSSADSVNMAASRQYRSVQGSKQARSSGRTWWLASNDRAPLLTQ